MLVHVHIYNVKSVRKKYKIVRNKQTLWDTLVLITYDIYHLNPLIP
jgi:hypothetical protein